jgi:hypothetical protein
MYASGRTNDTLRKLWISTFYCDLSIFASTIPYGDVLARYSQIARKTISLNGRLDMDKVVWEGFSKGENWLFDKEGQNPYFDSFDEDDYQSQNIKKLAAGLGYNRYTEKLASVDLSDVIFVTGEADPYVGDYTSDALAFTSDEAEGAYSLPEIGHSDIFIPELMILIHDMIINEE